MKCLRYFGITSMKEDTSAHLSGRGELHGGGLGYNPNYVEKVYFKPLNSFFVREG